MKYLFKSLLPVMILAGIIVACKPSSRQSQEGTDDSTAIDKSEIREDLDQIAYPLPEPFELYQLLENIGATYLNKVLNPASNVDKYFTEKDKALNVGVYAADLGYAATYGNKTDVQTFTAVLKSMIDDLGVRVDYESLVNEETRRDLISKDSLTAFITNVFYSTYTFLNNESNPSLAGLMAAGAWIEGLYIATHISDDTYKNYEIVKIIYQQGSSLTSLIQLLSKFQEDQRVSTILTALKKLKGMYDKTDGSLNEEQLKNITSTIESIRQSIAS